MSLTIPLTPPSVNHYVRHSRGRHYRIKAADDFMLLVKQAVKGREIRAAAYRVCIAIFFAPGQKGDLDNFAKVVLDSLVSSGAIDSDSRVTKLLMEKERVHVAPSTFIEVRAL